MAEPTDPIYDYEHPRWEPLEAIAAPEVLDDFMWMHAVEGPSGRMEAYKHRATRRYLYLTHTGDAWVVAAYGHFERLPPADALARVCTPPAATSSCSRSRRRQ